MYACICIYIYMYIYIYIYVCVCVYVYNFKFPICVKRYKIKKYMLFLSTVQFILGKIQSLLFYSSAMMYINSNIKQ